MWNQTAAVICESVEDLNDINLFRLYLNTNKITSITQSQYSRLDKSSVATIFYTGQVQDSLRTDET